MAENIFKSVNAVITTVNEVIYTAPVGITTIVINAQVANTSSDKARISFSYVLQATNTERNIIKNFLVDGNKSYGLTLGRLVVNPGDSLKVQSDTDAPLRLSLSILETSSFG